MDEIKIKDIKNKLQNKIIGREKYFNSAVLVSIIEKENELYFVLQKRAKNIRQGGEISFPGGAHDKSDKNFEFTAVRETTEELGINTSDIDVYGKIGTLVIPAGILVEVYLGKILCEEKDMDINVGEVERLLIVPVSFFKNDEPRQEKISIHMSPHYEVNGIQKEFPSKFYNMHQKYHKPWKVREREVYIYEYGGEVIWGITADIIYEVVNNIL